MAGQSIQINETTSPPLAIAIAKGYFTGTGRKLVINEKTGSALKEAKAWDRIRDFVSVDKNK